MISITIKKVHLIELFEQQKKGGWFSEYKPHSDFWAKRLYKFFNINDIERGFVRVRGYHGPGVTDLNLLCGKNTYLAKVSGIYEGITPEHLEKLLKTGKCFRIVASFYPFSIEEWRKRTQEV